MSIFTVCVTIALFAVAQSSISAHASPLDDLESIAQEAGTLENFLRTPALKQRYYTALNKFVGGKLMRVGFESLLQEVERVTREIPEIGRRLWTPRTVGAPLPAPKDREWIASPRGIHGIFKYFPTPNCTREGCTLSDEQLAEYRDPFRWSTEAIAEAETYFLRTSPEGVQAGFVEVLPMQNQQEGKLYGAVRFGKGKDYKHDLDEEAIARWLEWRYTALPAKWSGLITEVNGSLDYAAGKLVQSTPAWIAGRAIEPLDRSQDVRSGKREQFLSVDHRGFSYEDAAEPTYVKKLHEMGYLAPRRSGLFGFGLGTAHHSRVPVQLVPISRTSLKSEPVVSRLFRDPDVDVSGLVGVLEKDRIFFPSTFDTLKDRLSSEEHRPAIYQYLSASPFVSDPNFLASLLRDSRVDPSPFVPAIVNSGSYHEGVLRALREALPRWSLSAHEKLHAYFMKASYSGVSQQELELIATIFGREIFYQRRYHWRQRMRVLRYAPSGDTYFARLQKSLMESSDVVDQILAAEVAHARGEPSPEKIAEQLKVPFIVKQLKEKHFSEVERDDLAVILLKIINRPAELLQCISEFPHQVIFQSLNAFDALQPTLSDYVTLANMPKIDLATRFAARKRALTKASGRSEILQALKIAFQFDRGPRDLNTQTVRSWRTTLAAILPEVIDRFLAASPSNFEIRRLRALLDPKNTAALSLDSKWPQHMADQRIAAWRALPGNSGRPHWIRCLQGWLTGT